MEKEIAMPLPTRRHCLLRKACLWIYNEIMAHIALDGMAGWHGEAECPDVHHEPPTSLQLQNTALW